MIELVSVDVTNFRSFSHATFTPLGIGQGMTAINGTNGMGKSSVVHAVVWALYGVTPDGVRVGALRRQGSDGDVEAKIVFRHDGQTIEVTRGLRGRNDTTIASITVDNVEQTNVSAKTATAWVTARLGLDSEAFLIAFVVRQKELDSLVRARPADRRKTIERLAGIERMSAALDKARTEARAAARLLDALPDTIDPDLAQATVNEATTTEQLAASEATATEAAAAEARTVAHAAATAVTDARSALEAVSRAQHAVDMAAAHASTTSQAVTRLSAAAAGADDLPAAQSTASDARDALDAAQNHMRNVTAITARADSEAQRVTAAEAELARATRDHDTALAALSTAQTAVTAIPATIDADATAAADQVRDLADQRGATRGEWDRLKKAIDTLSEAAAHGDAACPTCAHALPDAAGLLATFTATQEQVRARGVSLTEQLAAAQALEADLTRQAADARIAHERVSAATSTVASAADALARAQNAVDRAADLAETAAEQAHAARTDAASAEAALPELQAAEASAQRALRVAENAAQAATELVTALSVHETATAALGTATADLDAAIAAAGTVDLDALEAAAREATAEHAALAEKAAAARTAHMLAERDLATATLELSRALAAATTRRTALADVERTAAVAAALDEFRRDRLARLTPELSEVASDFVARMTDGKYTSVVLDEDFTPILTDASGAERPVAWLSGGEESAVALALRVAIGEVLAGQRGGLLILDEVLTAQDQSRRQATMAAIRALPRQIITINHVSESTDMVDLVADVVSDGEGASTIVDVVPESAAGANVSDAVLDA